MHRKVHLRQSPGGVVDFLPVDPQVERVAGVLFGEFFRLDKHTAGAAAGGRTRGLRRVRAFRLTFPPTSVG